MKIYIAGKIGSAGVTAMRWRFDSAALRLRREGWETINLCDLAANAESWEAAMCIDLHALFRL